MQLAPSRVVSVLVLACLLVPLSISALAEEPTSGHPWLTDFDQALKQAGEQNKLVIVYFSGSDWCRPCMKLKSTILETEQFESYAVDKYVLVQLDFPVKKENQLAPELKRQNEALAEKYNHTGAFPLLVVLKPDGSVVGELSGYNRESVDEYISNLTTLASGK